MASVSKMVLLIVVTGTVLAWQCKNSMIMQKKDNCCWTQREAGFKHYLCSAEQESSFKASLKFPVSLLYQSEKKPQVCIFENQVEKGVVSTEED